MVSYYVDLAIGLILAFLLLSLLVSGLNEGLVRLLGIRSKFLWAYLRDTLDGGEVVEKVPGVLRWLDARLKGFSRFSRRLRSALADLLPPPKMIRSRLPATLLGVFAKLPFGKDPRPAFSPHPAPVHSPPLAAAADSLVAAEIKSAGPSAGSEGSTGAEGTAGSPFAVLPSDILIASTPADQAGSSPEVAGSTQADSSTTESTVAADVDSAGAASIDSAHGAEQADPREHGESLTDLLHERLQEIDEAKQGKTTIAEIPPSRFSVALLEIASVRGGVEPLLGQLQTLKSPLYRPLAAIWEKSGGILPALTPVPLTPSPPAAHTPFIDGSELTPGTATTTPGTVTTASTPTPPGTATTPGTATAPTPGTVTAAGSATTPTPGTVTAPTPGTATAATPGTATAAGTTAPGTATTPGTAAAPAETAAPSPVDMEAFRKGVEEWFDGEMTRLTLLYRRYVRWAVGILSLLVTLLFSMDALEYGKTLLNDNAYRSAVAAFADQGEQALAPIKAQCEPDKDTYTCVTEVLSTPAFVKIFAHAPVSATIPPSGSPSWTWRGGDWWDRLITSSHWPGFLLTLVALLFGAPFWWDMLRRVTGLKSRSTTTSTAK
ncbi:hypothetical protein Aple_050730 [Acrocarpospora pleiomorpha]|uniref:Uncharacterized protein n=1 Tax=Acrocarpospora pleiomorpha TaxID=90975 RepID=A0A5M3XN64_9ACTN|nr:hypothetical protein Aple_050730 [Acrocarpospora pleiomorpha]